MGKPFVPVFLNHREKRTMKNAFVSLVLLAFVSPAVADEALLAQLGLEDLQVVSQEKATEVRGLGYVYSLGTTDTAINLDHFDNTNIEFTIFEDASGSSSMELLLQGLSNLEGAIGSNNSIAVDFSQTEIDAVNHLDFAGTLSVTSGALVSGSAD